jgi:hypothetical protein
MSEGEGNQKAVSMMATSAHFVGALARPPCQIRQQVACPFLLFVHS